jgi:hypothetical protein
VKFLLSGWLSGDKIMTAAFVLSVSTSDQGFCEVSIHNGLPVVQALQISYRYHPCQSLYYCKTRLITSTAEMQDSFNNRHAAKTACQCPAANVTSIYARTTGTNGSIRRLLYPDFHLHQRKAAHTFRICSRVTASGCMVHAGEFNFALK